MRLTKVPRLWVIAIVSAILALVATQSASAQTGTISGRFEKVGVGGEALSALAVYVYSYPSFSLVASGNANADGTFSFAEIPYGSYVIFFSPTAQLSTPSGVLVDLASSTHLLGDFPVYVANHTISGLIFDELGEPATGYSVSISAFVNGRSYNRSVSSADGSYAVAAFDANWTVEVTDPSADPSLKVASQTVTVSGTNLIDNNLTISSYASWFRSHSLLGQTALPTADADGDTFNNQSEFVFGSNPKVADAALFQTTSSNQSLTVSWLERTNGLSYFVRSSTNLTSWTAATDANVIPGSAVPAVPTGYARKQFTMSASGKKFFRLLATDKPELVPDETFSIKVAGEPVTVERWGAGPKAVVFFGYISSYNAPFPMADNLKNQSAATFRNLVGTNYSMFLWTYPGNAAPFSQAQALVGSFYQNPEQALQNRLNFSGYASSVVSQIRTATGLTNVCLVGNSFGAGVVMADMAALFNDSNVRFVLVSPSEIFMPVTPPANNPLPRTVLTSDAWTDYPLVFSTETYNYLNARTNGSLPPGYVAGSSYPHFIIGDSAPLPYVFDLVQQAFSLP